MKILYVEVNDDNVYMLKNRLLGTLENLVSLVSGLWASVLVTGGHDDV